MEALPPAAPGAAAVDPGLLESLLSAAPIGAALLDYGGRYLWVNDELAAMNDVPAADHVGRTPQELLPQIGDAAERLLTEVLAGRGPQQPVEMSEGAAAGRERTFRQIWYPLRRDGAVVAVAVIVWEVTDEIALASSSERLDLALDAGGMGTWDWDLVEDHIRWDQRAAAIFGKESGAFGEDLAAFLALVHPEDVEGLSRAVQQSVDTRGELRREYRVLHDGAGPRWVSVRGKVLSDEGGTPEAMVGVMQDRSDIHSQGEQLARTLEAMDEAFFSLDRSWRFTYVNARAEELLQSSRAALLGEVVWDHFPTAVNSTFQQQYEHVMRTREAVTFEESFPALDLWVEVRAYPDPVGIAVYFRDVGARKRREREQEERAARERRAHLAAGRLLELSERMLPDGSPAAAATMTCALGVSAFECTRASIYHVEGERATLLAQRGGSPLPAGMCVGVDDLVGLRDALRSGGAPVFFPDAREVSSPVERRMAETAGVHSFVQAPVELGEQAGTLLFALSWDTVIDPLGPELLDVVARYAQQGALAIEQARGRLAQAEAGQLSAQLQANLLPTPALRTRRIDIASRYQPGEHRMLLGGDFYDVIEQPDGGIAMVIGDVTGHGPEAAAIGAALRAGWRTMALRDTPPAEMIAVLDALLRSERSTEEQLVSVCCVKLAADGRDLALASAGHPPPVISTARATGLVPTRGGLLLGLPVDEPGWEATSLALPDPWALLLYTDGLPEARRRPGSSDRLGFEAFADHVARLAPLQAADLGDVLDRLQTDVRAQAGESIEDDVALLLIRSARDPRSS